MKPRKTNCLLVSRPAGLALATACLTLCLTSAHAADFGWDAGGGADTNYNTAANWVGDVVPSGAGNNALIDTGNITITSDIPAIGILEVGRWFNPAAQLDHSAGVITTSASFNIGFYGTATYNLTGTGSGVIGGDFNVGFGAGNGTATLNSSNTLSANFIGIANGTFNDTIDHPVGVLNLNGGTLSSSNGFFMAGTTGSSATVTQAGGTLNVGGELWVANRGTGSFTQTQGTVNTNQWFVFSRFGGAKGTYTLSGGTVNATQVGGNVVLVSEGGTGATGTLNVSAGTFNVGDADTESDLWVTEVYGGVAGTGELNLSGTGLVNVSNEVWLTRNGAGTGTVNLNGGTLQAEKVLKGDGTGTFNFNGGTLRASQDEGDFLRASTANVRNGGAVVDTNGFNVTIGQALVHSGIGGDNATDGGLAKNGTGTLTLSGVNTYTGATVINGGTLALDATGTIDASSGVSLGTNGTFNVSAKGGYTVATLTGSGNVIGSLTVSTELAVGNSPGTATFSALTLGSDSTYTYELLGGTGTADLSNVDGNLILVTGTSLDLVQLGTYSVGDRYTLFSYSGTLSGIFDGLADDSTFTAGGGLWEIDYNDTLAGSNGGTFSNFVTITAVPEPGAMLLGAVGVLVLLRRRRH